MKLTDVRMAECEVSLRAAFFLLRAGLVASDIKVAIDGAQVQTGTTVHFPMAQFMADHGWSKASGPHPWRGTYACSHFAQRIEIHSASGRGDVVATLNDGRTLRAESKKGQLTDSKSSSEYPAIREALGQLMTIEDTSATDLLAVIVPSSRRFDELAARWRRAPLIARLGVQIWTVRRDGSVLGIAGLVG